LSPHGAGLNLPLLKEGTNDSSPLSRFFISGWGIILTGAVIGVLGPVMQNFGNPPNMGICAACFERDIAGALGLHRAAVVQYIRPEIIGFVLGSLIASLVFREFKGRTGSAPVVRFLFGVFAMIGALVFLGCPWRALLRLGGGDLNALVGLAGLAGGVGMGIFFMKKGYNLGQSRPTYRAVGLVMPLLMVGLLLLAIFEPKFSPGGAIFASTKGPGAMHAPLVISLLAAVVIGFLAQRSRFCTTGAIRNVMLMGETKLLRGVITLIVVAAVTNLILGQFNLGLAAQPIAHSSHLWNFLGMSLAGLAFSLGGGCPGRQLILSGEGDGDATVFVLGMVVGAAFAHNFALAAKPDKVVEGVVQVGGVTTSGMVAVVLGLVVCCVIGFTMREKVPAE
jgi:YedE family putative selenium metabolism protein